jgi:Ca2+-binding EF-hand superfamily protein
MCPLCNSIHDKNHKIIDYDKKNYICKIHKDSYISYCEKCKINLCFQCEELHKSHQIISFRSIFPNINEIKEEIKKFKSLIDNFKNKIKQIISILNKTIFCIENYYNINYSIINNFEIQEKNYQVLQNINEVNKNIKTSKNNIILNEEDICNTFKYIFQIYNQMVKKDFFSNKENKLNELKNSNKDISDEINKNVNTSKKEFDISIYEKKGYSKEEILDCKEAFDTFDSEKNGKINANELITRLKENDIHNRTAQNMIDVLEKSKLKFITFDILLMQCLDMILTTEKNYI